jgi:5'-nucleotidase
MYVGGFPRLVSGVAKVRENNQNTLLLHAGDVFQGTLHFSLHKGMADLDFMNMMQFDAMSVGNHEFDRGPAVLALFIKAAEFPILGANIDTSIDDNLNGLTRPYVIREVDGKKVAIVGLVTPETPSISSPGSQLVFSDAVEAAGDAVDELETKGINRIIILSHIGYERDILLAKAVAGVDIIVGGHSHSLLGDFSQLGMSSEGPYPTEVQTPSKESAFVVQAWEWARALGILHVVFDKNGVVTECEGSQVILSGDTFKRENQKGIKAAVSQDEKAEILEFIAASPVIEVVPEDAAATEMLKVYEKETEAFETQVISSVAEDLLHVRVPGGIHESSGQRMNSGSHVAPLVAEAMMWKARSVGLNVQVVLQNAGGVRTGISQGNLTAAHVYEILPFGNTLYVLRLNGGQLKAALETGVSRGGGAFPYVAGMRYTADMSQSSGHRITHVELKNNFGQWETLDENDDYLVGTNSYLAAGGDGYEVLKNTSSYRNDTGFVDAGIFIEYAKHIGVLLRPEDTGVTLIN